jgi:excisionase family DNA binding protein
MLRIRSEAQLITVQEAAELLRVDPTTVTNWIKHGLVPYIELPSNERKTYRLPLNALIQSLAGNYDLQPHVATAEEKTAGIEPDDDFAREISD